MTTKAKALDRLIDAVAGEDVPMNSQTVAGRLEQLAAGIEDGTISVGGGGNIVVLDCDATQTSQNNYKLVPRMPMKDLVNTIKKNPYTIFFVAWRTSEYDPVTSVQLTQVYIPSESSDKEWGESGYYVTVVMKTTDVRGSTVYVVDSNISVMSGSQSYEFSLIIGSAS